MEDQDAMLLRIADALDRLAPVEQKQTDWSAAPGYIWTTSGAHPVATLEAPPLDLLRGIDRQKKVVTENIARLAHGYAAHDMLLWGARGMGKSALVRTAVLDAQSRGGSVALVQVSTDALGSLPVLFARLRSSERNFLIYLDDLGFDDGDESLVRHLRSWLDGGVETRPANVLITVTSNRRAIVPRSASEQDDPVNPRDAVDDTLALADRFGLSLGFHNCSQDDYLDIIRGYTGAYDLPFDESEALEWAKRRGARSGRIARHFVTEIAGRCGVQL